MIKSSPRSTVRQMSRQAAVQVEIDQLLDDGTKLVEALRSDDASTRAAFRFDYQAWYTQTVRVIEILIPDRAAEFRNYYQIDPKRRSLHSGTYVIQDFCKADRPHGPASVNFDSASRASLCLMNQLAILRSVTSRLTSVIGNLQATILADVRDLELETAQKLQRVSLRAAGALAGVVLERHLQQTAQSHNLAFRKKPTLSDYAESLKQASVIDVSAWRKLSYLADIRNICCHSKDTDPNPEQVRELIDGVNWAIKTIL